MTADSIMRRERQAKIVATVGPASSSPERLRALYQAGVDTFRLNFSHGTHDDHRRSHGLIRALEKEVGRPIAILQDLQGPKIRIGVVADGRLEVEAGQTIRFVMSGGQGEAHSIPLPHPEIFEAVAPGQDLLIDDGRVRVKVVGVDTDGIAAEVLVGGVISNRKGVNLPGTLLDLSPLTKKDRADLAFGLELGMDWVALSFVQKPSDVIEARGLIGDRAGVMTKIEKPQALSAIDDIIRLSDAVMVARGDLGVEIPPEEVPARQKELIRACRLALKPVVVATQMLDSMVNAASPTRAEASDVATAVYDGADAVMLSAESATGNYPVEAVAMMDRIIRRTEEHDMYRSLMTSSAADEEETAPHAVATAAAELARAVKAKAIVAYTLSGTTAARVARKRPPVPILALTPETATWRRLSLLWGTHSVLTREVTAYEDMVANAIEHTVAEGAARSADLLVIAAGIPFSMTGTTNNIRVAQI